jgi:hypothetical protein
MPRVGYHVRLGIANLPIDGQRKDRSVSRAKELFRHVGNELVFGLSLSITPVRLKRGVTKS